MRLYQLYYSILYVYIYYLTTMFIYMYNGFYFIISIKESEIYLPVSNHREQLLFVRGIL